ncbi:MAG: sugar transferase [Faecalibacterium sp.]|nr:sugar transferase [Faecalibacterium sp.]
MYRNGIKRLLAIVLSLCGMVCLSWLFLILAVAIKLDSPGPVFFKQKRVGIGKKHFYILKFRTMRIDTPHDMPTHLLHDPDQYITRMGHFLRKTSLDELPQLWNILKGDMSFVGPRPLISSELRAHRLRLEYGVYRFRPGLTGWAQINGRDDISIMKKMKLDKEYCDNWSLKLDLIILWRSIKTVLKQEGFHEGKYHRR